MAQGSKPSDDPEIVREFDTRLLLVVFPVLCLLFISIFFVLYIFYFFSTWELVPSFFFSTYYTPMEVVPPVGMLVYTAVYTLAADGAVFDTPKKN